MRTDIEDGSGWSREGGPTPVNSPVYPHLVSTTSLASYTVDDCKSIGGRGVGLVETSQWLIESAHFATLVMKVVSGYTFPKT